MRKICAWCGQPLDGKPRPKVGEYAVVSHGICKPCAAALEAEAKKIIEADNEDR